MTTDPRKEPTMRLTDEQITATVSKMQVSDDERAAILRRALAGDPGTRFAVYAKWRQQAAP